MRAQREFGGEVRGRSGSARRRAFTLLELLTVVAVIALLAALFFPAVNSARRAAQVARTKVQFAQWATAIAAFRAEYGSYPELDPSGLVNGGAEPGLHGAHPFHDVLAGRRRDGSAWPAGKSAGSAAQNVRRIRFHAFGDAEFADDGFGLLCDASGNTAIAVLVDRDLDGFVRVGPEGDYPVAPAVAGIRPAPGDLSGAGVRAGVIFYAPAPGATPQNPRWVFSWK